MDEDEVVEEKPQPKSKPTETGQSTATWLEDPKGIYFKDSAISFFNAACSLRAL